MEDAASLQKQGDDDLNPSEYLAKHVYPVLEPAIVELLKAAFPADFKEFVRRASVAAEETQLLELQKQQEDKAAEVKGNEDGEAEAPPAEEEKEEKPAQPEAEKPLEPGAGPRARYAMPGADSAYRHTRNQEESFAGFASVGTKYCPGFQSEATACALARTVPEREE